jgi:hypothetical protein
MTRDAGFKDKVRARMRKTGESYRTAKAVLEGTIGSAAGEGVEGGYDPLDTLKQVGVDEDDLPMYLVNGEVVTHREALWHLVEEGLADPGQLRED